jgi:hypothetical protein
MLFQPVCTLANLSKAAHLPMHCIFQVSLKQHEITGKHILEKKKNSGYNHYLKHKVFKMIHKLHLVLQGTWY